MCEGERGDLVPKICSSSSLAPAPFGCNKLQDNLQWQTWIIQVRIANQGRS